MVASETLMPSLAAVGPWEDQAACVGQDRSLFFPHYYSSSHCYEARAICCSCPVLTACRAWAIPQARLDGIWGAMTPRERDLERRSRLPVRYR